MSKKSSSELRRRKKGSGESSESPATLPPKSNPIEKNPADSGEKEDASLYNVIAGHPLIYVLVLVGIPYAIYVLYRVILLQHPPSSLRPAVSLEDPRQVLILGTMSSGTSSMAEQLAKTSLEIGHEDSDTAWKFVRDGTVSWFHGIRYWPEISNHTQRTRRIAQLCKVQWTFRKQGLSENYGFGPTLFGNPQYNCSFWHPQFQSCYRHACQVALDREYSCAAGEEPHCQPPFTQTLLQTREPWKIVASLTAKYCYDSSTETISSKLPVTLQWLLLALQTSRDPREHCVVQMIRYVTQYYNHILQTDPNIRKYRIEDYRATKTPCGVLELMGLNQSETTVYAPNHEVYQALCVAPSTQSDEEVLDVPSKSANAINKGRVSLAMIATILKQVRNSAEESDGNEEDHLLPLLRDMEALYETLGYLNYPSELDGISGLQ